MYQHILIPVSFDEDQRTDAAVPAAAALSAPNARVSLLHVMAPVPKYTAHYLPEGYRDEALTTIETSLANIARGLPDAHGHVIEGQPGRQILKWASDNTVDCIVIPAHRVGMADTLLGGTAAQVVRHAHCAVHLIR